MYILTVLFPGIIHFTQLIRVFEKQDPAIAELNAELKQVMMPLMAPHIPDTSPSVST